MSHYRDENQKEHEKFVLEYYERNVRDIGAVRSGLSDAAHMVDNIRADIMAENTLRNGRVTLKGIQTMEALQRASIAIWALHEQLKVREPT